MLLDLTLPVSAAMREKAGAQVDLAKLGHMGTHFDVMDKEFPLAFLCLPGVAFDVSAVQGRDIDTTL